MRKRAGLGRCSVASSCCSSVCWQYVHMYQFLSVVTDMLENSMIVFNQLNGTRKDSEVYNGRNLSANSVDCLNRLGSIMRL